jgi:SAM-dependent methyltransferase
MSANPGGHSKSSALRALRKLKRTVRPVHEWAENRLLLPKLRALPQHYLPGVAQSLLLADETYIADVGGASGQATARLDSVVASKVVFDVDRGGRPTVVADAVRGLPVRDTAFDAAVSLEVLEHIVDPLGFLVEVRRIVRPGGHVYLSTRQYWRTHGAPNDYFRYTAAGLSHLFASAGLTVDQFVPLGGPFAVMAAAWDQALGLLGLARPVLKELLIYPVWFLATILDHFFMRSAHFSREPDTTGWLVFSHVPYVVEEPAASKGERHRTVDADTYQVSWG